MNPNDDEKFEALNNSYNKALQMIAQQDEIISENRRHIESLKLIYQHKARAEKKLQQELKVLKLDVQNIEEATMEIRIGGTGYDKQRGTRIDNEIEALKLEHKAIAKSGEAMQEELKVISTDVRNIENATTGVLTHGFDQDNRESSKLLREIESLKSAEKKRVITEQRIKKKLSILERNAQFTGGKIIRINDNEELVKTRLEEFDSTINQIKEVSRFDKQIRQKYYGARRNTLLFCLFIISCAFAGREYIYDPVRNLADWLPGYDITPIIFLVVLIYLIGKASINWNQITEDVREKIPVKKDNRLTKIAGIVSYSVYIAIYAVFDGINLAAYL